VNLPAYLQHYPSFMLNVKQGSCEYQLLKSFVLTRAGNRTQVYRILERSGLPPPLAPALLVCYCVGVVPLFGFGVQFFVWSILHNVANDLLSLLLKKLKTNKKINTRQILTNSQWQKESNSQA